MLILTFTYYAQVNDFLSFTHLTVLTIIIILTMIQEEIQGWYSLP